ncbi:hypothetical protein [Microbispora rosea]|uniref:hypothetical protein n=1 Tax=Microbispora rosea TaxID=58117 RepID=UPI00379986B4
MSIWAKLRQLLSQPPTPPAEQPALHQEPSPAAVPAEPEAAEQPPPSPPPPAEEPAAERNPTEPTAAVGDIERLEAVIDQQKLDLIGLLTVIIANIDAGAEADMEALRPFLKDLLFGAGAEFCDDEQLALLRASVEVIVFLVDQLSIERDEPVPVVWQHVAESLTAKISERRREA